MKIRPKHRLPRLWTLAVLLFGPALFFGGCVTPSANESAGTPAEEEDPLTLPNEASIGTIVMIDPEEELALIRMRSSSTRASPSMATRNDSLMETSRLEPTRFQTGRTLGARIVSGLPNVGDEVVVVRD